MGGQKITYLVILGLFKIKSSQIVLIKLAFEFVNDLTSCLESTAVLLLLLFLLTLVLLRSLLIVNND